MGNGGYTRKNQPDNDKLPIDGIRTSGGDNAMLEADGLTTKESPENGKADGDNPSMPTNVPFGTK